ncbi:uncharacterized protein LOC124148117 isoform X1 [Haliotis rufescens]|uniref:uncharacterized protein LOC124148117 isoform X1 n=1 Tax=Haliotis rufescens TaxID=6454 RepID=UPI00201EB827|nr:uncharacterized protein LOC124148117 isoform X1 [Haliotis rufescens]
MSSISMKIFLCVSVLLVFLNKSDGCTFPSDLTGDWVTSSRSTLTFTSTTFTPWTVTSQGTFTFTCLQNNGSFYISKSNSFSYVGLTWYAYLCMDLNAINSNAFYYNLGSSREAGAGNDKVKIFADGTTITQALICDDVSYTIGTHDVMVKSGAAASAASSCPTDVQAKWMYSLDAGSGDTCSSGSYLEVCTDTTAMNFNYTSCNSNVAYSAGGSLYCIYNTTSGANTYLTLYNNDITTDEASTYRFTCMVLSASGSQVYMTQYPQQCLSNQTSTSVVSPGATLVLQNSTSCNPTTTAPTTTAATATTTAPVSSALATGLGVTFGLLFIILVAVVVIWCLWKQNKENAKIRGDKDVEGGTQEGGKELDKPDGAVPPDVLPTIPDKPQSPSGETLRPTTSGSIHVTMGSADESERDSKLSDLSVEEHISPPTGYNVVGVHPGLEDEVTVLEPTPVKTFAPQRGVVPKGAVSLSNGTKPRPKVGKRTKLPPVEGKPLPPIKEDITPRGVSGRRGSQTSLRRKFGQKGIVGVEETSTESGEELPGQPQTRGVVKLRPVKMQRGGKKPVPEKPEKKVRTRSYRDAKDSSVDDDDYVPPSTPIKITRVDIPSLAKEDFKRTRSNKSDMKVVDMDDEGEKNVSKDDMRGMSPESSYNPSSLYLRGSPPDIHSIVHAAPIGMEVGPDRGRSMLRDRPMSSTERPRPLLDDRVGGTRSPRYRAQSARNRSASFREDMYGGEVNRDGSFRPVSSMTCVSPDHNVRARSRSRSRGRKKRGKGLVRSQSEIRPSSAPAYAPRSIMLDVEELPQDGNSDEKVLAARSLAIDMEQINVDQNGHPVEKNGTKRGRDVRPKSRPRAKTALSRATTSAVDNTLRFWVFFSKPIILLTRQFRPSGFMRRREEAIADNTVVEDWSLRSPRSPRRVSTVSSQLRRNPVKIEFGTADVSRIRDFS